MPLAGGGWGPLQPGYTTILVLRWPQSRTASARNRAGTDAGPAKKPLQIFSEPVQLPISARRYLVLWGFPKIGDPTVGVLIVRIIAYGSPFWGPHVWKLPCKAE